MFFHLQDLYRFSSFWLLLFGIMYLPVASFFFFFFFFFFLEDSFHL